MKSSQALRHVFNLSGDAAWLNSVTDSTSAISCCHGVNTGGSPRRESVKLDVTRRLSVCLSRYPQSFPFRQQTSPRPNVWLDSLSPTLTLGSGSGSDRGHNRGLAHVFFLWSILSFNCVGHQMSLSMINKTFNLWMSRDLRHQLGMAQVCHESLLGSRWTAVGPCTLNLFLRQSRRLSHFLTGIFRS